MLQEIVVAGGVGDLDRDRVAAVAHAVRPYTVAMSPRASVCVDVDTVARSVVTAKLAAGSGAGPAGAGAGAATASSIGRQSPPSSSTRPPASPPPPNVERELSITRALD